MQRIVVWVLFASVLGAQSLGTVGTIDGSVSDPSGLALPNAAVTLENPASAFRLETKTDAQGVFHLRNIPFNTYTLRVQSAGFTTIISQVSVRSAVPQTLKLAAAVAATQTAIEVSASSNLLLDNVNMAHSDIAESLFDKLPARSPASGLSDVLMFAAPGIAADSNGFIHPLGDHAQVSFLVDGQPINDQQSKGFSTQMPLNAIAAVQVVTGAPPAENGDKSSLIVNTTTKSGLGRPEGFGSIHTSYGSFGTAQSEANFGFGGARFGNFLAVTGGRTGRFLDTPEFRPYHAIGNNSTIFDRVDFRPSNQHSLHLNILGARNWFQVPNTFDNFSQDQKQSVTTANFGLGWLYTINPTTLLTVNPFFRQDRVNYYPSRIREADDPVTLAQDRHLTNWGVRTDASIFRGRHNIKFGFQGMRTTLAENLYFGVTNFAYNPVCLNAAGDAGGGANLTDPGRCAAAGLTANPELQPGLIAHDFTRGGSLFRFNDRANINQMAVYLQDQWRWRDLNLNIGFRFDRYAGVVTKNGPQPRAGLSYQINRTGTVLRVSYSHTLETPYNENLLIVSSTGSGGIARNVLGAADIQPIQPGSRNQYNAGLQQRVGRFLMVEADYYWKYTRNGYDFAQLLTTPLVFPISWRKSSIDGYGIRMNTPNWRGFQALATLGGAMARFFGPSNGGFIFDDGLESVVFRIDHDQAFQQTTNLRYQPQRQGWFVSWTWRYDSGLVSGGLTTVDDLTGLSAAQQSAIGFYCGNRFATLGNPITSCASGDGALRYRYPGPGQDSPDHFPTRVSPRHLQNFSVGTDSLIRRERQRMTFNLSVSNVFNKQALYNFLSPFGGTHFVPPRMITAEVGWAF
jgi:hypothetical protein